MRILVTTHGRPDLMPRVMVTPGEIVAGPCYNRVEIDGRLRCLNIPGGHADFGRVLQRIPQEQRPELVLVHADATMGCAPLAFPASLPRILLVGDTHHLDAPLRRLLQYASDGGFAAIICWNRQHAHFFKQAGFSQTLWMPGLTFGIPSVPPAGERLRCVSFFGQIGAMHPRRKRLVDALQGSGLPFACGPMPRSEGLEFFARSLIAFNSTLNGEINLRVFEAAATGAMLLTDRLSQQTGLNLFFKDGESMVCYDSPVDLVDKARHYLTHPGQAMAIAARAGEVYSRYFTAEARREAFFQILRGGNPPREYLLQDEPRCLLKPVDAANAELLRRRVAVYEWTQELHRTADTVAVDCAGQVPPQVIADLSDLQRIDIRLRDLPGAPVDPRLAGIAQSLGAQVRTMSGPLQPASLLVTDLKTLLAEPVLASVAQQDHQALFVWDLPSQSYAACAQDLASLGLEPSQSCPALFTRKPQPAETPATA